MTRLDRSSSSGGAPLAAAIGFNPGDIVDIPDNADPIETWVDWPNATVSQTVAGFDGKTVLVDATMYGVAQEPAEVLRIRLAISLDDGASWDYGDMTWIKRTTSPATYRFPMSSRHTRSGLVSTNVIVKAQYNYAVASAVDAIDFAVRGTVIEVST